MKKSKAVALGVIMTAAIAACGDDKDDEWTDGAENGRTRDTTLHGHPYRHYGGFWYPIYGGMISPNSYNGATTNQIASPDYRASRNSGLGRRAGGFGSRGRSFGG